MSSLQALLDAQERRRGASIAVDAAGGAAGGGGGKVGRGCYRPINETSWSSSHSLSATTHPNRTIPHRQSWHRHSGSEDKRVGNIGSSSSSNIGVDEKRNRHLQQFQRQERLSQEPPSASVFSTRWQREREEVAAATRVRRGGNNPRWGRSNDDARNKFNSAINATTQGDGGREEASKTSYEQRRANIEQRAINDSRNAIRIRQLTSQGRRHSGHHSDDIMECKVENSRHGDDSVAGGDVVGYAKTDDTFDEEEDIKSLSSWVGPLLVVNIDGEEKVDDPKYATKMMCTYFQDREKRYPFYTDERGYRLLHRLLEANHELLRMNHRLIGEFALAFQLRFASESSDSITENPITKLNDEAEGAAAGEGGEVDAKDVIIRIGRGLYAHKPTLRTKGVTWSTEEYSHPGLARMYLRMKSIQRFTEIWCLLERSAALGAFDDIFDFKKEIGFVGGDDVGSDEGGRPVVRIAAVGGGPGFELLATKLFFEEMLPNSGVQLELTCMDICPAWRHYAQALGFAFVEYDINNDDGINPLQAMGLERGELHFCIVSCVMIYVTNDRVMNMFHSLVHNEGVKAVLVSERGERTLACTMMEELGGKVIRLIDQSDGMDERQAIWCSREFADEHLRTCYPDYEAHQSQSVFPNVPYCEHKERRRRRGPLSGRFNHGSG